MTMTTPPNSVVILHGIQAQQYVTALSAGKPRGEKTVADAISDWREWMRGTLRPETRRQNRIYIEAFARDQRVDDKPLSFVTEQQVSAWVNDGVKLGSRRSRLAIVRGFFKFAWIRHNMTTTNPSLLVRVNAMEMSHEDKESRIVEPFTDTDFKTLLAHLDARIADYGDVEGYREKKASAEFWRAAIIISRSSGLRMGDVASLERECFSTGEMVVWSRKRGRRVAPHILDRELFESVTKPLAKLEGKYCFPQAQEIYANPHTRCTLTAQFGRMCAKLGLKSTRFHSLRSAYCCECVRLGMPMEAIAKSVGHKNLAQTAHYAMSELEK